MSLAYHPTHNITIPARKRMMGYGVRGFGLKQRRGVIAWCYPNTRNPEPHTLISSEVNHREVVTGGGTGNMGLHSEFNGLYIFWFIGGIGGATGVSIEAIIRG